jgi:hypothetical protein
LAADPQDAPRHAGQVVRRVLLRRNIAIDAETAQLVVAAVQAALQAGAPSPPPRRRRRVSPANCEPLFWLRRGPRMTSAGACMMSGPARIRTPNPLTCSCFSRGPFLAYSGRPRGGSAGGAEAGILARGRQPGLPPRFARVLGRQVAADEPVTVQRRSPAQRPAAVSGAAPLVSRRHSHIYTCSSLAILTARITVRAASHRRPAVQAIISRPPFRNARPARAPWPGRCPGSRGSGESAPGHGRSLRALRRPMRMRFITDLPRGH